MSDFLDDRCELSVLRKCWTQYQDPDSTHVVKVRDVEIGAAEPAIIAGPCAIESNEQTLSTAQLVRKLGVGLMRGGVFKPRTNPHSFQGLGQKGLEILAEVRRRTGLGIVTEVMDPRLVEDVAAVADMLQVGSRSMQNFPLLREVGMSGKPVLLKRGWSATLEEWLGAAEYIALEGNPDIVLCERGVRASCHQGYARNILDLNIIEPIRRLSPLPIIVDPSHATGEWSLVEGLSRAALAVGAHGLLLEVKPPSENRSSLRCDAEQGIPGDVLERIVGVSKASEALVFC